MYDLIEPGGLLRCCEAEIEVLIHYDPTDETGTFPCPSCGGRIRYEYDGPDRRVWAWDRESETRENETEVLS